MLQKKLMMNGIWASARHQAEIDMNVFQCSTPCAWAYCAPPSYRRRDMPARPWMNIGMKMTFMKMSDSQKCSLPRNSFILRPVTFGNQ